MVTGYWNFDESYGNAADSSGNGLTLTNSGVTYTAGKLGKCAVFDGFAKFTGSTIPAMELGNNTFTVSFWIKTTDTDGLVMQIGTFSGAGSWVIGVLSSQIHLSFAGFAGGGSGTAAINDNSWRHIVCVREGTGVDELKIYIDGALDKSLTQANNITPIGTNFYFGLGTWNGNAALIGSLDNFKLTIGTAWSADDVLANYNLENIESHTFGEKELKTSWDALTASDSTKAEGHEQTLRAEEGTFIPRQYRKGI